MKFFKGDVATASSNRGTKCVKGSEKAIESVNKDFFIFKRDRGDSKLIDKGFNARGVLINAFRRGFFLWYRELTLNQEYWIGY